MEWAEVSSNPYLRLVVYPPWPEDEEQEKHTYIKKKFFLHTCIFKKVFVLMFSTWHNNGKKEE